MHTTKMLALIFGGFLQETSVEDLFISLNFEGIGLILATPTAPMKTPTAPMKTDLPLIQVETAMVSKPTDTAFCVRDPSDFGC